MKSNVNGGIDTTWARAPPTKGPLWYRFLTAIYDPKDKSFLGRTPKRWGIVLVFYLVFYAALALLTAICFGGLLLTIDIKRPKYTLDKSLIGANPGVSFRPQAANGGWILKYDRNNATYNTIAKEVDEFLKPYAAEASKYSGCNSEDNYGFPDTPCFFIKVNKIFDWEPEYYDDVNALPADMPEDLVQYIKKLDSAKRKKVWVSCTEEKGNSTSLEYPWSRGLPGADFPFRNSVGYQSPLVAVKVTAPVNELTTLRCRAWAKNIMHNHSIKDASGYARIQFQIEDSTLTA